jgi:hypothetical protein
LSPRLGRTNRGRPDIAPTVCAGIDFPPPPSGSGDVSPSRTSASRSSNKREAVRSKDGRRFDMASYRSRSGSAVAPVTRGTSGQAQINGRR